MIKLALKLFSASLFLSLAFAKLQKGALESYQEESRNKTLIPSTRVLQHSNYYIRQIGEDIDGEDYYGRSGRSLSLSNNGMLLAVSAYSAYGYTGHVITYAFDTNTETWVQRGQKIKGDSVGDYSGGSLCLSHDGMTMAIGKSQYSRAEYMLSLERSVFSALFLSFKKCNPVSPILYLRCESKYELLWSYPGIQLGCDVPTLGKNWSRF